MGPLTRKLYYQMNKEGRRYLTQETAHFLVDREFFEIAAEIAESYPVADFTDKTPHTETLFEIPPGPGDPGMLILLGPDKELGDSVVSVALMNGWAPELKHVGHWVKKSREVGLPKSVFNKLRETMTTEEIGQSQRFRETVWLFEIYSTMLELVCEPRIVDAKPFSRNQRRNAERQYGKAAVPEVWLKCSWTVGSKTTARRGEAPVGSGKPYHLVRGHWRNYGPRHTPKAVQRPGRPGWWVWIDSHHSGHPMNGVVQHKYTPKVQDPGMSSKVLNEIMQGRIEGWKKFDHDPLQGYHG